MPSLPVILFTVLWVGFVGLVVELLYGIRYLVSYKRRSHKFNAEIISVEEYHDHEEEDCCGPHVSLLLKLRTDDGSIYEKYISLNEVDEWKDKKHIMLYVNKKNPNKFNVDLNSVM